MKENHSNLFGYPVSNQALSVQVGKALCSIRSGKKQKFLACANPHSMIVASSDPFFEQSLKNADILLPDGTGIVLACRLLKLNRLKKIAGTDFFMEFSKAANKGSRRIRYFFLGSNEEVLTRISKRVQRDFPNIEVCGTYSPPFADEFTPEDNKNMLSAINKTKPDVLWVGMTAPKQEKWIYRHLSELDVHFAGAIGAGFDFFSGTKQRSSQVWIDLGLEWLPRFMKEPRRLFERNMKSTPIFLFQILKTLVRNQ